MLAELLGMWEQLTLQSSSQLFLAQKSAQLAAKVIQTEPFLPLGFSPDSQHFLKRFQPLTPSFDPFLRQHLTQWEDFLGCTADQKNGFFMQKLPHLSSMDKAEMTWVPLPLPGSGKSVLETSTAQPAVSFPCALRLLSCC